MNSLKIINKEHIDKNTFMAFVTNNTFYKQWGCEEKEIVKKFKAKSCDIF